MLDAIHENSDINMEITFIANPSATELLGNKSVGLDIPTTHIIIIIKKLFVAFPRGETSTGPGGFMICVFII